MQKMSMNGVLFWLDYFVSAHIFLLTKNIYKAIDKIY